jgi:hypothetical protein
LLMTIITISMFKRETKANILYQLQMSKKLITSLVLKLKTIQIPGILPHLQ